MGATGVLAGAVWFPRLAAKRPSATEPQPTSLVKQRTHRRSRFDAVELPLDAFEVELVTQSGGLKLGDVRGDVRTNGGIFEPGFVPTGLLVVDGQEHHPLNRSRGVGNFYLAPNGVFLVKENRAEIVETSEYDGAGVLHATQSGPLLVRQGELHRSFSQYSSSVVLRSGVGVKDDGRTVVLAISRDDMNLWKFAVVFRDALGCPDALYLDGFISALWEEDAGRDGDLHKGPFASAITATRRQRPASR
jgi:uncharacterized protein YigE (DUF2233 family)